MVSRLEPNLDLDALGPEQRRLRDEITDGPRSQTTTVPMRDGDGAFVGPFPSMLLQPRLGHALQSLGTRIRYEGVLSDRHREIATLIVAVSEGSRFEFDAHAGPAARAGAPPEFVEAIAAGAEPAADGADVVLLATTRVLLGTSAMDDGAYARACAVLGADGLMELVVLVGYYRTLAMLMRTFDTDGGLERGE